MMNIITCKGVVVTMLNKIFSLPGLGLEPAMQAMQFAFSHILKPAQSRDSIGSNSSDERRSSSGILYYSKLSSNLIMCVPVWPSVAVDGVIFWVMRYLLEWPTSNASNGIHTMCQIASLVIMVLNIPDTAPYMFFCLRFPRRLVQMMFPFSPF